MAGPYYMHSYSPGKQIVLARNPNYRGDRPARPQAIDITIGAPTATSINRVIAGEEDYTQPAFAPNRGVAYGDRPPARRATDPPRGPAHQRFFENPAATIELFALNTARPLFAHARLRRAANFAIDRNALAALQGVDGPRAPPTNTCPPGDARLSRRPDLSTRRGPTSPARGALPAPAPVTPP